MKEASPDLKDTRILKIKMKIDSRVAKFIFLFIIFISFFYFLSITFESFIPLFNMQSTTQVLHLFLKTIGINSSTQTNHIIFSNFSVEIVRQCTGIFEVIALSACILAYPAPKEKKFAGIIFFVPSIYVINIARLVFLSILGIYYPSIFEAVHDYLLQLTFVFLVVFFWIFWIEKVVKSNEVKKGEKG